MMRDNAVAVGDILGVDAELDEEKKWVYILREHEE